MFSTQFIEKLQTAKKVAVLTGAGFSAESGVPTFRGEEGLWKKYRPEDLANVDAFMRNPRLVWEWYDYRKRLISEVKPNPGHYALVKMEEIASDFCLITQNVDGLHRKAGSREILELHGNIMQSRCMDCNRRVDKLPAISEGEVPYCPCGGMFRPDVVWFGEMLDQGVLTAAFQNAETCDVFFSIGTSAVVQPAASLPLVAKNASAFVVEVNVEPTVISERVDESVIGLSGEVLPKLLKAAWQIEL
jgi:NAD-dependent deacetylase